MFKIEDILIKGYKATEAYLNGYLFWKKKPDVPVNTGYWIDRYNGVLTWFGYNPNDPFIYMDDIVDWYLQCAEVKIPDGVRGIYDNAFENSSVTNMILPSSVEMIYGYSFYNCTLLLSINLPSGVKEVWGLAFGRCTNLKSIDLSYVTEWIGQAAFTRCEKLTTVKLPSYVNVIEEEAFSLCTSLEEIIFPATSDGEIKRSMFSGCIKLKKVDINYAWGLSDDVFFNCTSLTTIDNIDDLGFLGSRCFYNCTSLTQIDLYWNITEIGASAFQYCTSLNTINIHSEYPPGILSKAFDTGSPNLKIHVPSGTKDVYIGFSPEWASLASKIVDDL